MPSARRTLKVATYTCSLFATTWLLVLILGTHSVSGQSGSVLDHDTVVQDSVRLSNLERSSQQQIADIKLQVLDDHNDIKAMQREIDDLKGNRTGIIWIAWFVASAPSVLLFLRETIFKKKRDERSES